MLLHGGNNSGKTTCGKPLARRWWVKDHPYREKVVVYGMESIIEHDQRREINCKDCLKALKKTPDYITYKLSNPQEQVGLPAEFRWAVGRVQGAEVAFVEGFRTRRAARAYIDIVIKEA